MKSDGEGNSFEVLAYENNRNTEIIQLFDFSTNDGSIGTPFDALTLYNKLQSL